MKKNLLIVFASICGAFLLSAFTPPPSYLSGPGSVTQYSTYTYTYNDGLLHPSFVWSSPGGTVVSYASTGTSYTVDIQFTAIGNSSVIFTDDGIPVLTASKTVVITEAAPPAPSTTFTFTQNCNNTNVTRTTSPAGGAPYTWYWQTSSTGTSTTLGSSATINRTTGETLYLRARNTAGTLWSTAQTAGTPTIITQLATPATATDGSVISNSNAAVTVSVSAVPVATSYRWFTQSTGGTAISGATSNTYSPTLTIQTSQTYYVEGVNSTCVSASRKAVVASKHPEPVISTVSGAVNMGGAATLKVENYTYSTYQWINAATNADVPGATTSAFNTTQPGNYKVRVTKGNSSTSTTPQSFPVGKGLEGLNMNYVATNTILKEGVLTVDDVDTLGIKSNSQSIQFFDGLGSPMQTVVTQGSPLKKDIIQQTVYDAFGREHRKYLPVVTNTNNGWYKPKVLNARGAYSDIAENFYKNNPNAGIAQDTMPFSQTVFEASPASRPLKDYGAGSKWTVANKSIGYEYRINTHATVANDTAEKIIAWKVTNDMPVRMSALTGYVATNGYYADKQLTVKIVKDEQGNRVREYTNKQGQVILKKVQVTAADSTNLNSTSGWALTYYVYDHMGNLRFVLPPELSRAIHTNADSYVVTTTDLGNWAFQYTYDLRKRMVTKQVPGSSAVYMVYDKRDRIVATQDANQRSTSNKYWSFTKYDQLNRPILTGIKDTAVSLTQAQMQSAVDAHYAKAWTKLYETYTGTSTGNMHGYTNKSYPVITGPTTTNDKDKYLSVTYYDNYDFKSVVNDTSRYSFQTNHLSGQDAAYFKRLTGQVTGAKIKVLDGGVAGGYTWLTTVNYYDDDYHVIQLVSDNYKGGAERITNTYDFTGKVLKSKATHVENDPSWTTLSNIQLMGNQLKSTSTTASANAVQQLAASTNGWLEAVYSEGTTTRYIGFNDTSTPSANLKYTFQFTTSNTVYVKESGTTKATITNVKAGDIFRITRTGTAVTYTRNGTAITLSPASTASSTLLIAIAYFTSNSATLTGLASSVSTSTHSVTRRFVYDHAGRVLNIWHQLDAGTDILLVKNEYNELGQLVDKKLHSTVASGTNAKQSIDYRYNIRGWLTKLNESDISVPVSGEARDLFGMELLYNESDAMSNTPLYNGNISAIKWSNNLAVGAVKENAYAYSYDPMNRIKASAYKEKSSSWTAASNNGNAETGFTYDLNGNVLTLQRNDTRTSGWMDNLAYTYASGNQLQKVADAGDDYKGFIDGSDVATEYTYDANGNMVTDLNKGLATAITYNFMNLPEVVTKGNNTINYIYDAAGRKLAQVTTFGGIVKQSDYAGGYQYENDLLQHIAHEEGRIAMAKTETVYTNSAEATTGMTASNATLAAVTQNGTEKYVRATSNGTVARTGIFPVGNTITVTAGEQYRIRAKGYRTGASAVYLLIKASGTDLNWPGATLANGATAESWTEQTITIPTGATSLQAGVVWNTVTNGEQFFLNEFEIVKVSTNATPEYQYNLKDHLGNVRVTFTSKQEVDNALATLETANATTEQSKFIYYDEAVKISTTLFDHTYNGTTGATYYSTRLVGGSTNSKYGLAKSLSVMPGDTLNIEVYGKYLDTNSSNWTSALTNFMASIANGSAPAGTFVDGGAAGSIGTQTFPYVGTLQRSNDNGTGPKGYLNYILFDRNFVYKTGGFKRLSTAAKEAGTDVAHERLFFDNLVITEPGYIYIYLSNENETNVEVYFDDFKVQHKKSPVVQSDDYYAFGAIFNSYSRENSIRNKRLYQTKEYQEELNLNLFEFGARQYDPWLVFTTTLDPLAEEFQSYSPYSWALGNPLRFIDPSGMAALDITLLGANNSSVTIKTDLVNISVDASGLGVDFGGNYSMGGSDIVHAGLDIAGVFDPTGIADGANAALYASEGGSWGDMLISAAGVIPLAGDLAKVGRIGKGVDKIATAVKAADKASDLAKAEARATKLSKVQRPGEKFTKAGKEAVVDVNKAKNNGKTICRDCKTETSKAKQDKKGVKPPGNRTEVDHRKRRADGGSGTPDNGDVTCRDCNAKKH